MAELKTQENDGSVEDYLLSVEEPRRGEARQVIDLMQRLSGQPARMWGKSIVGFGHYDYDYASGRTGTWMRIGMAARKKNLTLYIMPGFAAYEELLGRLGKHKTGKSCLYVNKLADVDLGVLEELVGASLAHMAEKYPEPAG